MERPGSTGRSARQCCRIPFDPPVAADLVFGANPSGRTAMSEAAVVRRRGGTAGRRAERASAPIIQKRYIAREIPVYELLDAAGLEIIHGQSMTILEEIGIDFRDEPALALWRAAGADIRCQRVRIP